MAASDSAGRDDTHDTRDNPRAAGAASDRGAQPSGQRPPSCCTCGCHQENIDPDPCAQAGRCICLPGHAMTDAARAGETFTSPETAFAAYRLMLPEPVPPSAVVLVNTDRRIVGFQWDDERGMP